MVPLSDQQLADFQKLLDWKTGIRLPDGRVLGVPRKGRSILEGIDPRVRYVAEKLKPAEKTLLEVGCLEGTFTVQLAKFCRSVTAIDIRPKNVLCTLTNLFIHDLHNVQVKLADARELTTKFGTFDVIFHLGVLYHLMDPVGHLFKLAGMCRELVLDTHVCLDDTRMKRADVVHRGKTYRAHRYKERGWKDVFSGADNESRWLHYDALREALSDAGFASAEVVQERSEPNGPRVWLLARRAEASSAVRAA
ncbi:MAG: methyltransferase domain-containing protein [Planctomycetia bacterium]|nr:methyltransferase domain-containing protein [Planctomycetia bacterium]